MARPTRPNILLVMTDQHSPRISGFAGDRIVRTQHLDALASGAVQFDTAVCASPLCTPSRMCMMTAKEAHNCAAWSNHWIIFPEHVTWPGHFAKHGYHTCLVGKMHYGGRDQMQGFQHRPYGDLKHGLGHQPEPLELFPGYPSVKGAGECEIPESLLQDVIVTRETLSHVLEHQDKEPDKPWFVCASYNRPHPPLTAPGRYIRRYRNKVPPAAAPADPKAALEPFTQRIYCDYTAEEQLNAREAYYGAVDFVDDCIGELLNGLEAEGALENTIVIYTSDHGEMAGEHGLWNKFVYYDSSVGVPLLMRGPGIKPGHHHVAHPVSLMDLFPTTCTLAGLPIPEGLDGIDCSPLLTNPATEDAPRRFAPSESFCYGVKVRHRPPVGDDAPSAAMRTIREKDWKYVEVEKGARLLFNMADDPGETRNLADDPAHADRLQRMQADLHRNFSWEQVHRQLEADRKRMPEFLSGVKPSMPNQYMLPDGRIFDAEKELYDARWLYLPPEATAGIIPQQFG